MQGGIGGFPQDVLRHERSRNWRQIVVAVSVTAMTVMSVAGAAMVFTFHLGIRNVLSPSMKPTYGPGWVVVTKPLAVSAIRPGDIVVFEPPGEHATFAHRVVSVSGPKTSPVITTKGDANPVADPWHAQLTAKKVPQVVFAIPLLGWVLVALQGHLAVLMIAFTGIGLAISGAKAILRGPKRDLEPGRSPIAPSEQREPEPLAA